MFEAARTNICWSKKDRGGMPGSSFHHDFDGDRARPTPRRRESEYWRPMPRRKKPRGSGDRTHEPQGSGDGRFVVSCTRTAHPANRSLSQVLQKALIYFDHLRVCGPDAIHQGLHKGSNLRSSHVAYERDTKTET